MFICVVTYTTLEIPQNNTKHGSVMDYTILHHVWCFLPDSFHVKTNFPRLKTWRRRPSPEANESLSLRIVFTERVSLLSSSPNETWENHGKPTIPMDYYGWSSHSSLLKWCHFCGENKQTIFRLAASVGENDMTWLTANFRRWWMIVTVLNPRCTS